MQLLTRIQALSWYKISNKMYLQNYSTGGVYRWTFPYRIQQIKTMLIFMESKGDTSGISKPTLKWESKLNSEAPTVM